MPNQEPQALPTAVPASRLGGPPPDKPPQVTGWMDQGREKSPLLSQFLPCAKFKQVPHHLQTEGPRGGRRLQVATEDSTSMTIKGQ